MQPQQLCRVIWQLILHSLNIHGIYARQQGLCWPAVAKNRCWGWAWPVRWGGKTYWVRQKPNRLPEGLVWKFRTSKRQISKQIIQNCTISNPILRNCKIAKYFHELPAKTCNFRNGRLHGWNWLFHAWNWMLLAWNWLFQKFEFCSNSRNHSKVSMAGSKSRFCLGFEARFLVSQNNTLSMLEITV